MEHLGFEQGLSKPKQLVGPQSGPGYHIQCWAPRGERGGQPIQELSVRAEAFEVPGCQACRILQASHRPCGLSRAITMVTTAKAFPT